MRILPHDVVEAIDGALPWVRDWENQLSLRGNFRFRAPHILPGILRLIAQVPEELLVLSPQQISQMILAQSALEAELGSAQGSGVSFDWPRMSNNVDCVAVIRDTLAACPDEAPSRSASELEFIPDEPTRRLLGIDLGSTERALHGGEWKAAMVLAGSVIEALLLWAIQLRPSTERQAAMDRAVARGTLTRTLQVEDLIAKGWDLHSYIEVAFELEEIKERTANVCRDARYYRNLIHPAVVERDREKCSRGRAHSSLGALYSTIEDLKEKHSTAV